MNFETLYGRDSGYLYHIAINANRVGVFSGAIYTALCDGRKLSAPPGPGRPKRVCRACQQKQRESEQRAGE